MKYEKCVAISRRLAYYLDPIELINKARSSPQELSYTKPPFATIHCLTSMVEYLNNELQITEEAVSSLERELKDLQAKSKGQDQAIQFLLDIS